MANNFQGIQSGLAELKNYYQGPIIDQFSEDLPVKRAAEKVKQGWNGFQVVRPLRVRRNPGIGATSDGGTLPAIGRQATVQALISSKFNYLRFGVTGPMIKASSSDVGSFVRAASYELEMGYEDLANDCNRQYNWTGDGEIATVNANAVASTTVDITGRTSDEVAGKFIDVGTVVDFYTAAGALVVSGVEVTAIANPQSATATLTLSSAVTVSATDVLVRSGSFENEINGLFYSIDGNTSTIYSVDRSTYPAYQSNSVDASSGQLTLDLMQQAYNEGLRRGGKRDASYSAIYTDFDSLRFYQKLLTPDKRYANTVEGDGGFAKKGEFYLDFNGLPVVADKDMHQVMFFVPHGVLKDYVLADMEFADETGTMYIAQTSADSFEVRLRYFSNLFNEKPSACAVLQSYISP